MFYVLNVAVLYNGLVWGQMDIVLTCFILFSYYFALEHKVTLSILFFVIAINFKLQAIIFIPPLGLMLLPQMVRIFSFRELFKWITVPLIFQILVILPFYFAGTLELMWQVILGSFKKHESISIDAYNIWHLIFPNLTVYEVDTVRGFLLTHKQWGLLFFFISSFFALLPFFKLLYKGFKSGNMQELPLDKSLLVFALIPLLFFYCNTEMHERYAHPGLIFIMIYSIRTGRPILAFTASWA
ncbi:MAG: hypothetical protein JNL60_08715 [Bacteroidia bacterium]|nr:hypothetical protein [Bacteroidia bacterium]